MLDEAAKRRDAERVPLATAIVDAYPNWNGFFSSLVATWTPDGKSLVFGSQRDGLPEIYIADAAAPDAPARALTVGPERALDAAVTWDGKYVLFTRDHEGDENHALWRIALDGSGATNLTPDPAFRRSDPLLPRDKPALMLYTASHTADSTISVYRQDIGGGAATLVYTQSNSGGAADVTADGTRILVAGGKTADDNEVSEVEVATGKAHRIYPADGTPATLSGASYTQDGSRVLVTATLGETTTILALDHATGKELARYVDKDRPTANLSVSVAQTGGRIALGLDAGDHGEVKILDAKTMRVQRVVDVPLGDIQVGAWRPDGRAFGIVMSRPDQPAEPFAVDAETGKVTPLRADPRPALAKLPPIESSIEHVAAFDGLSIPVNQYLPRDRQAKLPTIVIFHGGPSTSYAVRWSPYARFFLSLGYAVLEPNVRGSSGFGHAYEHADDREKRADWLQDLATVNAWVKRQPWCDADRVVVWGQSYGGYTTLMALTRQPTAWRAGVDLYGPADMKQFLLSTDAGIRAFFVGEFGDVDKDAALLEEFSPMRDVDKIVRPLFVYAGAHDPRVPLAEDETIVKALRARKVPVEFMVAANEGHTVDRRETKIELLTRTARFLEDALR